MEKMVQETTKGAEPQSRLKKTWKIALLILVAALVPPVLYAGYIYAASPEVIRSPKMEHYHFRMQILVNGKAEDFGTKAYQTGYAKDQCNANLPEQPIHFHDNKDQFTHIHWEGMTGGMVMKYYGWNYIGGVGGSLGYKLDDLSDIQEVTTHGSYLPTVPGDAKFYVYTGDETTYKERRFDDWKNQDLEQFFGKTSNFPGHKINKGEEVGFLDALFPTASAHGTPDDADGDDGADLNPGAVRPPSAPAVPESEEQKLTRINNLIGSVVIFVQKDAPTDQQIKDRFDKLEPLTDSTCGG